MPPTGLIMKYFVLKPRAKHADDAFATASQCAMQAFADSIEPENEPLARELRLWARNEARRMRTLQQPS